MKTVRYIYLPSLHDRKRHEHVIDRGQVLVINQGAKEGVNGVFSGGGK